MAEIEVEKKFKLTNETKDALISGSTDIGEETNHDIYYDYSDFRLYKKGIKLRSRNGKFELKIKTADGINTEFKTEEEIRNYFRTSSSVQDFVQKELIVFADYKTEREKFLKEGLNIDIDHLDFGKGYIYDLCEIELMLDKNSTEEEKEMATAKVLEFARKHGMEYKKLPSKLKEYLKARRPEVYNELHEFKQLCKIKMK